jgi:hypothetical protein
MGDVTLTILICHPVSQDTQCSLPSTGQFSCIVVPPATPLLQVHLFGMHNLWVLCQSVAFDQVVVFVTIPVDDFSTRW